VLYAPPGAAIARSMIACMDAREAPPRAWIDTPFSTMLIGAVLSQVLRCLIRSASRW
jgi:hypothetical protein